MAWFTRRSASFTEAENQRRHFRLSIELPIAISVEGLQAEVFGTLIDISETGCRFRSLILLERERVAEFTLKRPSGTPLTLRGRIGTRRYPPSGGGYEYGIGFIALTPGERDALSKEIVELQRREAAGRSGKHNSVAPVDPSGAQRRAALRASVSFPIRYRVLQRAVTAIGEASDISMGGLRLSCSHPLDSTMLLDLRFTLPSNVLDVYPPASERTEISPFGVRRVRVPDNRRPFEEMALRGRIVTKFQPTGTREVFGVSFFDIDGYQREEIARFIHATQLSKIRSK